MVDEITVVFVCGRCFSTHTAAGPCPLCRLPRVRCEPGGLDDQSRQPPMDQAGRLLSRAPLWWVRVSRDAGDLLRGASAGREADR
jgi:hypothetical protein